MIIKSTLAVLAISLGLALCSSDQAVGSSCGRAEVQAACGGYSMPLRRGQVRRAQRREARAARRQHRLSRRATCGVAATCAAPVGCGGVAVITPQVQVHVAAPVVE